MMVKETLKFLAPDEVVAIGAQFGTPVFVYDRATMREKFDYLAAIPHAFGLRIRYSVKANPNRTILRLFDSFGAHFDVSSAWEAQRLVLAGIAPHKILMTAQEASAGWQDLCRAGMLFDAGSLEQLDMYGREFPGSEASIRINPGFGSGLVKKLTSGGSHSSFGIWVEHLEQALAVADRHRLKIVRLHFHIGSGHESTVLEKTVELGLRICDRIPTVDVLNLGGGYKVAALADDPVYDHHAMGERIAAQLREYASRSARQLQLELEPGTYLMGLAGSLITRIIDVADTGASGNKFLKIDGGLTEIMRPSYYGARHPLVTVPASGVPSSQADQYIVCGHCCIAGDNLTPLAGNSEDFSAQELASATIGDFLVVERTGGYAASMSVKNFNSYPEAAEVLRRGKGDLALIRRRQTLDQLVQNEVDIDAA